MGIVTLIIFIKTVYKSEKESLGHLLGNSDSSVHLYSRAMNPHFLLVNILLLPFMFLFFKL